MEVRFFPLLLFLTLKNNNMNNKIYFIMRSDNVILTNNVGLPNVWVNLVLAEAMAHQLNATSKFHNLEYSFRTIESETI
jgi:hypothetical protein